jgi:hypothetical protein
MEFGPLCIKGCWHRVHIMLEQSQAPAKLHQESDVSTNSTTTHIVFSFLEIA